MLTCSRLLIAFTLAFVAALSFGQAASSPLSTDSQQPGTSESTDCAFGGAGCASSSQGANDSYDLLGSTPSVPGVGVPSAGSMLGGAVYTDNAGGVGRSDEARPPRMSPVRPAPLTEFQMLVAASVGRIVPIYGADLFVNMPDTFAPVMHIPVTPEYVIGPGDQLLIRTWGQVNLNLHLVVDRSGSIYVPQIGEVRVAGLQFGQLQGFLKSQFAPVYRNFDLNVNLGQLHSIQVFVTGQARRPGSYTISSLSTLVNAIFACGGPQPHGSLRHIQLRRGANLIADFDLYDLLLRGDKSKDVPLETGDVIYFPPAGAEVAVVGSVFQPAIYEMRGHETVSDAIALAGGVSAVADASSLEMERSETQGNGASARVAVDVSMTSTSLASSVQNADIIRVRPRPQKFDKTVTLRGNVANPGRYAWHEGMRIHDLLPDKQALLTPGYWLRREHLGLPVDDYQPLLPPLDEPDGQGSNRRSTVTPEDVQTLGSGLFPQITMGVPADSNPMPANSTQYSSLAASTDNSRESGSSPNGKVNSAKTMPIEETPATLGSGPRLVTTPQFPIETQVVKTSPDIDWNYAVVERIETGTLSTKLIPFNLGKAVNERDAEADVELRPGDVVTILSEADIRVPREQQTKYVRLEGEIAHAGVYSVLPGETLRQLVVRAGGLTAQAYLFGSQLTRESTQKEQQQRLDEYVAALAYEIEASASNKSTSVVSATEAMTTNASVASQRELVNNLKQARATGRIVLHIQPTHETIDSIPDMPLEDGDRFVVPPMPSTVGIVGAVYDPNSFVYQAHRDAGDYLRNAGGPNRNADRRQIFIIRADGTVISKQSLSHNLWSSDAFDREPIYPGDTIVIPEAINKTSVLRGLTDWSAVFSQFALGAAAIQVIK
ncbi:MAG TPA: SLBB domain-containing protein [Terracidiphilus sp.]|nr:SLBB domain-containing protein [Terracidiphilus sp.]